MTAKELSEKLHEIARAGALAAARLRRQAESGVVSNVTATVTAGR